MENKENKKIDNEYQGQGWNRMSTRMFDDFHHQQHLQHQNIHNSMVNDFHHISFPSSVSTFHTEWSTTLTSGGDGWSISYTNVNKPALFVMAIYFALLIFSWVTGFDCSWLYSILFYSIFILKIITYFF